ncbi:hydantoinase B/oxoprolinase family protein [Streptomyces sp. TS71-3]|uniref:hydantoinase B/oxoprolinase family protein n=1 Tax=Streptomyces sp. TS71-3 TaxID=2733862 RepID=UPI001B1E3019|nr:hydantoinase B/oxoprolinase family protein [Streptomyces sp. TS71-3]GHJ38707.1 N-methylhydantoinase B [Streptomyces sp. TS71-3]
MSEESTGRRLGAGTEGEADAITVEVIRQSLIGVVQEMQNSLFCTGYSTIIRESKDASCAIADLDGRVVAQYTVLPLHLGAFPETIENILRAYPVDQMRDGDAFLVNHPYYGGSPHATDMAVLAPIVVDGEVFGFSGSIAHKSDIGGLVPGTNSSQAREIFHEGLMVPPVRYYRDFAPSPEVDTLLRANSRTPHLVLGDLRGQVGATHLAADRVRALCAKYGKRTLGTASARLLALTERQIRAAVAGWPDGRYTGERRMHSEGMAGGKPVAIRVAVTIEGDRIDFDFTGSDDQMTGPYNIRPPLVRAVCSYALKCLVDPELPSNSGFVQAMTASFRSGSLLDPLPPAPVNTYMPVAVATAEALFDAFGKALTGGRIAESSSGTNGTFSYRVPGQPGPKVQYELPAGAMGARWNKDGVSASKVHVANGGLTPVEVLETEFPVRIQRFELVTDSGGPGRYRGGLGYLREYRVLGPASFTTRNGRELTPPAGRSGGLPGRPSVLTANPGTDREAEITVENGSVTLGPGDVVRVCQAGGGGYGDPRTRPVEQVLRDVREGYVSPESARAHYGVAVVPAAAGGWEADEAETGRLRGVGG